MSFVNKKKCYLQLVAKVGYKQQFSFNVCIISCFQMPWVWSHAKWKKINSKTHIYVFLLAMGRNMVSKVIVCMITSHNDSLWSWMLFLMKTLCS